MVKKYAFLNIDATQDELDGKYGISFLKKFKVIRSESEAFNERDPEDDEAWTDKDRKRKHIWDHKYNMETSLPAGRYLPMRNKTIGAGSAAFNGTF